MSGETIKANHLVEFELNYELAIRKLSTTRNVSDKRKILGRALAKEKDSPDSLVCIEDYEF